jgi:hypothetical protein
MDNRVLDYEAKAKRPASGALELILLVGLTTAPLLQMFGVVGTPFETLGGTVLWCVWVGAGAVLPWRYVRRGKHSVWAAVLAVFCSVLLLWVLGLEAYWLIQRLMGP